VMGLAPDASAEQIRKRFRELARKYHPDLHREHPEYHQIFLNINQAYEVLSDPSRRAHYDLELRDRARREAERRSGSYGSATASPRSGAAGGRSAAGRPRDP